MFKSRLIYLALFLILFTSQVTQAHTVWLEDIPDARNHYLVRFGGHAGVLETYSAERLREAAAFDPQGKPLAISRRDEGDAVQISSDGDAALLTLFFDNGDWSKLANGSSVNLSMDQAPRAVAATRAVKYHKRLVHWNISALQAHGQPFELLPTSTQAPKSGETFELLVLIDGQPAAGIPLAFYEAGEEARTDAHGKAQLVARSGLNYIWAGQRRPIEGNAQISELSIEYSLVFHAR